MTRSLTILGATGSIGRSTAEVVLAHREEFRVEAVVGGALTGATGGGAAGAEAALNAWATSGLMG